MVNPTTMSDDARLIQAAASPGPDAGAALNALIARHVHFVYSACLRQLPDPVLTDQATSATFVLLSRHAAGLTRKRSLVPWLFNTAFHACRSLRALNPQAAAAPPEAAVTRFQIGTHPGTVYVPPTDWSNLAPRLDDALARLPADHRDALLLKYFVNLPLRDVAAALNVSDITAGQRISAGVAGLRAKLERHNLLVAPDALVAAIQARAVQHAPPAVAQNAMISAAMSRQPTPPGQPPAFASAAIADHVSTSLRRARWITAASAAAVVLLAVMLGVRVV